MSSTAAALITSEGHTLHEQHPHSFSALPRPAQHSGTTLSNAHDTRSSSSSIDNHDRIIASTDPSTSVDNAAAKPDIGHTLRPLSEADGESQQQQQLTSPRLNLQVPQSRKQRGTMEYSQSPTQSNDGRSYDQYANDDSPGRAGSRSPQHLTLHDDDTGAVKFDFDKPSDSQATNEDPSSFDPLDPLDSQPITEWTTTKRQQTDSGDVPDTSSSLQPDATSHPPETPAVVQRPFGLGLGLGNHAKTDVITASQLFAQTQFTSAVKAVSPTSSRPSPYVFNHNTISPNHAVSSPLKDRGLRTSPISHGAISSPPDLQPSSRAYDTGTSQDDYPARAHHGTRLSPVADNSPPKRRIPGPIESYRSVSNLGLVDSAQRGSSDHDDSDSDADLADAARLRRVQLKRRRAEKSLQSITFSRVHASVRSSSPIKTPKSPDLSAQAIEDENVEVPSTNRAKSRMTRTRSEPSPTLGHIPLNETGHESDSQETVADSQHAQEAPAAAAETTPDLQQPSSPPPPPRVLGRSLLRQDSVIAADMIPETSPAGTAAAEYTRHHSLKQPFSGSNSATPSLPPLPSIEPPASIPASTAASGIEGQIRREIASARDVPISSPMQRGLRSSPTVILASSQRMVTRSSRRLSQVASPEAPQPPPSSDPSSRTSSLSSLSATPPRPSSATPNTEHEGHEPHKSVDNVSSPAVAKVQRRGRLSPPVLQRDSDLQPNHDPYSFPSGSTSRASSRQSHASRDTASTKSPTRRRRPEPKSRALNARKSLRQTSTAQVSMQDSNASLATIKDGLFQGMTFAVTFQSKQRHEDDDRFKARVSQNKALKDTIIREGGMVLSDGFDALFSLDHSRSRGGGNAARSNGEMTLKTPEMGFTALIADEHSRKAKYIQALALGLPCLAPRWITTCVAKRRLVDWSSYLLCAGQSAFLGEAIRSRNLPYYDPTTSQLSTVIERRPKLLENTKVLVVLKRTTKEDSMPYLFLVQVLGATLTRVHSLDEARALLLQRQAVDEPFDWVYVGDRIADPSAVLYGSGGTQQQRQQQGAGSRKRKRTAKAINNAVSMSTNATTSMAQSTAPTEGDDGGGDGRPPKRVRTLDDELVVQSLILGRLIEEDEMPL